MTNINAVTIHELKDFTVCQFIIKSVWIETNHFNKSQYFFFFVKFRFFSFKCLNQVSVLKMREYRVNPTEISNAHVLPQGLRCCWKAMTIPTVVGCVCGPHYWNDSRSIGPVNDVQIQTKKINFTQYKSNEKNYMMRQIMFIYSRNFYL